MSRTDFGAKPFALPQPWIIAACDKNGVPDAMNAAWGRRQRGTGEPLALPQAARPGTKGRRSGKKALRQALF